MTGDLDITLALAAASDLPAFQNALQQAFTEAAAEYGIDGDDGPIPSDADVQQAFQSPGAAVYHLLLDGARVGGAVLHIDSRTHRNSLALFYIASDHRGRGLGLAAWNAIEARYPQTAVWELGTPAFERRNLHFYVNKCGFHIVEFFNERHADPHAPAADLRQGPAVEDEGFFRLEKVMSR
ncbi:GNAT family N-acetyltransferase [Glycomyces terrestris]|uniref:GNAT family N-acetyltransferase n=1 Tax=Glycomyces terrestris TaxID=2493553 RepID=A0A426V0M3_9ACTN|nr:GNAT family N-acetyltransferase [Glycomyces terrestris]RRS00439.1 GNAT family N-acetyltransferase [Glycomyces terrestris]